MSVKGAGFFNFYKSNIFFNIASMIKSQQRKLNLSGVNGREIAHISNSTIIKRMVAAIAVIGAISASIVYFFN